MKKISDDKIKRGLYSAIAFLLCVGTLFAFWMSNRENNIETDDPSTQSETKLETTTEDIAVNTPVTNVPDDREDESVAVQKQSVYFAFPLENGTVRSFSNGELVKNNTTNDWRTHTGVDLKGVEGDPVKAICSGTVISYREDALWGTVITIDHGNGITAQYSGLEKGSTLQSGDSVAINDTVGKLSTIPLERAEGVHLHLEIHKDGVAVDPENYLGKRIEF